MRLVRSGDGPMFRSNGPEWLEDLLLRKRCLAQKIGAEDGDCIMFADQLREAALQGRLRATFTHIPHEVGGGTRNAALRYSLAAALGLVAGSTDFVFLWKGGGCWMEFKRAKLDRTANRPRRPGGTLSPKQRLFRDWCALLEVPHHVVTSSREGLALLQGYGVFDQ